MFSNYLWAVSLSTLTVLFCTSSIGIYCSFLPIVLLTIPHHFAETFNKTKPTQVQKKLLWIFRVSNMFIDGPHLMPLITLMILSKSTHCRRTVSTTATVNKVWIIKRGGLYSLPGGLSCSASRLKLLLICCFRQNAE